MPCFTGLAARVVLAGALVPGLAAAAAVSVRDVGARGDGRHDDSAAFRTAFEKAADGVVHVPPGRGAGCGSARKCATSESKATP